MTVRSGNSAVEEVMNYIHEPTCSIEDVKFTPLLREMFLKFNTPLPSSGAVERLFSQPTLFKVGKYNRLTDKKFEIRVLAKVNMHIDD